MNIMHSNTTVTIRYGLWIALQIALGLFSIVVLYQALDVMTCEVSGALPHGYQPWLRSPFSNPQNHAIAQLLFSLIASELILWLPASLLDKNRWLVLFSLVCLTTSTEHVYLSDFHHKTNLTEWVIIPYGLSTVGYLIRFQWRFIPEKTLYDLLLGPLFLWVLIQGIVNSTFADMVGPPEQADDIAALYGLYFLPTLFIYPGLFPKKNMRFAVVFSLILFGFCLGVICNRELMGYLVDGRRDIFITFPVETILKIGSLYFVLLLLSLLGRFFYYGHICVLWLWKNRQNLMKYRFSDQST